MVSVRCGLEALVLAPVVFERLALLVLGGLTKGTFVFEIFSLEIEKEVLVDLALFILVLAGSSLLETVVEHESGFS